MCTACKLCTATQWSQPTPPTAAAAGAQRLQDARGIAKFRLHLHAAVLHTVGRAARWAVFDRCWVCSAGSCMVTLCAHTSKGGSNGGGSSSGNDP